MQRSAQPSPARMKLDNPQVRKHEHKDISRSCTPASQHSVLRMDGSACRVSHFLGQVFGIVGEGEGEGEGERVGVGVVVIVKSPKRYRCRFFRIFL